MQILHTDTQASWIQEGEFSGKMYVWLPEGTRYWTIALWFDEVGVCRKQINVAGQEYEILG